MGILYIIVCIKGKYRKEKFKMKQLKEDYKNGIGNLQNIKPSGKDKVWITDGIVTRRIKIGKEIPNGFKIGRLPLKVIVIGFYQETTTLRN